MLIVVLVLVLVLLLVLVSPLVIDSSTPRLLDSSILRLRCVEHEHEHEHGLQNRSLFRFWVVGEANFTLEPQEKGPVS